MARERLGQQARGWQAGSGQEVPDLQRLLPSNLLVLCSRIDFRSELLWQGCAEAAGCCLGIDATGWALLRAEHSWQGQQARFCCCWQDGHSCPAFARLPRRVPTPASWGRGPCWHLGSP